MSTKKKNAPGSRTDIGWEHGCPIDGDKRKVQCKYCQKNFTGGIYRFKQHLAGSRKDPEACKRVPDDVKTCMQQIVIKMEEHKLRKKQFNGIQMDDEEEEASSKTPKGKGIMDAFVKNCSSSAGNTKIQSTLNQVFKSDLREKACQKIAQFFYTSAIPFNCVKNPKFAEMLEMVGRYGLGFKPPSYHEIREKYLKQEVTNTIELLEEHKAEWKQTGCSIMSDGWTDTKRRSICNFLVNSPKGTVFLSSIDMSNFFHTADKIFEMLDDVVDKVGEENVVQVITDNAANYKAAGVMLMEKRKKLFWTPCAAHCIDLILEDFEKKIDTHRVTISKGRKVTTYIYSRTMLISMLKHFTKGRDLIRLGATRFATAYLTLGCLSEQQVPLMTMFSSNQWKSSRFASKEDGKQVENTVLDINYWKDVKSCLKAAFPLIKVLRMVDSDDPPAMGFLYEGLDRAKEKIQLNFKNIKKRYMPIWKIIDARWGKKLHKPLHATTYYLNPQFHYLSSFKADPEVKRGLYDCLARMVIDENERNTIHTQLSSFKKAKGLFGDPAAKAMREKLAPANWWDSYGDDCPELQKFAIRVLSLTCSSSGCERNWSAFEMVHTKRRNRLHQKKMNDLVFVMFNSKLKDKPAKRNIGIDNLDNIPSDDEWIAGDGDQVDLDSVVDVSGEDEVPTFTDDPGSQGNRTDDDLEIHDIDKEQESDFGDDDDDDDRVGGAMDVDDGESDDGADGEYANSEDGNDFGLND